MKLFTKKIIFFFTKKFFRLIYQEIIYQENFQNYLLIFQDYLPKFYDYLPIFQNYLPKNLSVLRSLHRLHVILS